MYYGISGIKKAGGYASFCCIKKPACGTFALLSALVMSNSDISNLTLISASGAVRDNKITVSTCHECAIKMHIPWLFVKP